MGKSLVMKYIDIHTHSQKNEKALEVKNLFAQDPWEAAPGLFYSMGIHPWHIGNLNLEDCFQRITDSTTNKNMLFVGECGIDRSIELDFAIQEECFKRQVQIAESFGKPLIIHCVRAYSDLIRIKKESKSSIPWVIHGYNGNLDVTLSLVKHEFYFSIGDRFLKNPKKRDCLKHIPTDRIFFETDESQTSIEEIYQLAALVVEKDKNELLSMIWDNFRRILKTKFDVIF